MNVIRGELEYRTVLGDEWWNNIDQLAGTVAMALQGNLDTDVEEDYRPTIYHTMVTQHGGSPSQM